MYKTCMYSIMNMPTQCFVRVIKPCSYGATFNSRCKAVQVHGANTPQLLAFMPDLTWFAPVFFGGCNYCRLQITTITPKDDYPVIRSVRITMHVKNLKEIGLNRWLVEPFHPHPFACLLVISPQSLWVQPSLSQHEQRCCKRLAPDRLQCHCRATGVV